MFIMFFSIECILKPGGNFTEFKVKRIACLRVYLNGICSSIENGNLSIARRTNHNMKQPIHEHVRLTYQQRLAHRWQTTENKTPATCMGRNSSMREITTRRKPINFFPFVLADPSGILRIRVGNARLHPNEGITSIPAVPILKLHNKTIFGFGFSFLGQATNPPSKCYARTQAVAPDFFRGNNAPILIPFWVLYAKRIEEKMKILGWYGLSLRIFDSLLSPFNRFVLNRSQHPYECTRLKFSHQKSVTFSF